MPFWCYMHVLLLGKKGVTWPPEGPQSNMVIKFLGCWRQSICLLRFQSPAVKNTKLSDQAAKKAVLQNHDLIGVATLVPQTDLPETPSYTEGKTLKAKSESFQEEYMRWFQQEQSQSLLSAEKMEKGDI